VRAAWYERQGAAADVFVVGEMDDPEPGPGEVRIRIEASGVNPGDVKKRQDRFGRGLPYPRVIPHSDGAGVIDAVAPGADDARVGQRVWCFGAQSYRPFGTAAEYVVVPDEQAILLPDAVTFEQGACLGIPGITAHRSVHVAGEVAGKTVLIQGGAGAVGQCAIGLARHAGARVAATVRSAKDEATAQRAGAHWVIRIADSTESTAERIRDAVGDGVDHIVEVAFDANIELDAQLLRPNGSIATYATRDVTPGIPFWPLVFKNISIFFLGSDDFSRKTKAAAAEALNEALLAEWPGFEIAPGIPLDSIANAHIAVEEHSTAGRVVVTL